MPAQLQPATTSCDDVICCKGKELSTATSHDVLSTVNIHRTYTDCRQNKCLKKCTLHTLCSRADASENTSAGISGHTHTGTQRRTHSVCAYRSRAQQSSPTSVSQHGQMCTQDPTESRLQRYSQPACSLTDTQHMHTLEVPVVHNTVPLCFSLQPHCYPQQPGSQPPAVAAVRGFLSTLQRIIAHAAHVRRIANREQHQSSTTPAAATTAAPGDNSIQLQQHSRRRGTPTATGHQSIVTLRRSSNTAARQHN
jgi:hypothetical protein